MTGSAIGDDDSSNKTDALTARFLLDKLERMFVPIFYRERLRFVGIMLQQSATKA